jgi:hypothetical protein
LTNAAGVGRQISRRFVPNCENAHNLALRQRLPRRFIVATSSHFLLSEESRKRFKLDQKL